MALASEKITEQEKAAIVALTYGYIDSWPEAYRIAAGQSTHDAERDPHFTGYASRWKNSAKVKTYYRKVQDKKAVDENDLIREWQKENERKPGRENERSEKAKKAPEIDYSDPENQRRKLNELINEAQDPGEALDALKVIINGQRDDRQAAKEGRQVRAYLPLSCHDCVLYQKAAAKAGKM